MKQATLKRCSVFVAAIAISLGGVTFAASPSQAAENCNISAWSEVDGSSGSIIFYPSYICYSQKLSTAMQTFPSNGGNTWANPTPGQWYSGNGIVVPIGGPGEYCAYIQLTASTGSGTEEYYGQACTYI